MPNTTRSGRRECPERFPVIPYKAHHTKDYFNKIFNWVKDFNEYKQAKLTKNSEKTKQLTNHTAQLTLQKILRVNTDKPIWCGFQEICNYLLWRLAVALICQRWLNNLPISHNYDWYTKEAETTNKFLLWSKPQLWNSRLGGQLGFPLEFRSLSFKHWQPWSLSACLNQ